MKSNARDQSHQLVGQFKCRKQKQNIRPLCSLSPHVIRFEFIWDINDDMGFRRVRIVEISFI